MSINLKGHLSHRFYTKGRFEVEDQRDRRESLSFFRGDTVGTIEVQVFDKADLPVDITDYLVKVTVKRYVLDDLILFQVDSAVEEDAPYVSKYNAEQGVIHWTMPPAVSETFPPGVYHFDVQLYIPEDLEAEVPVALVRRTVLRSAFSIKQDITTDGVITG